jgi:phosphatidylserine/phosphatidylglycerophosphate/cardiolipin synthase-like enzyme
MASRKSGGSRSRARRRRSSRLSWPGVVFAALLICVAYFWWTGDIQRLLERYGIPVPEIVLGTPQPPPLPPVTSEAGEIQAFFSTPYLVYPDVPKDRVMPPFEQAIIADIDGAQQSIELATFEYNLKPLADALVRASQRGVQLRVALDRETLEDPTDARWAGYLEDAQIPIAWEDSDAFLHSKFIIVDGRVVWTGSWNVTINDTYRNNNNLLRITIPPLVQNYQTEFEQMFAGRFSNSKLPQTPNPRVQQGELVVENYFSPSEPIEPHILERLANAQQSVRFLAFSYTSDPIADAMIDARRRGLVVQGVMETRNVAGSGSEFEVLRDGDVWVLEDGNCYTMHHKVIIVDDRTVITGSYNFTGRAEDTNDENLLIIDNPTLAGQYLEEFQRVFAQAEDPTRCQN